MNNEERTILIEKYLNGELKGNELKSFELKLKTDGVFAQDCSIQKNIRETLKRKEVFELREKLNNIRKDLEKQSTKKRIPVLFYAICAIITIAVIITICFFNKSYTNDELYSSYYEQYDAGTITRGVEKTTTDIFIQALRNYDHKQFFKALALFHQISDTSNFFVQKEYFTGLSYMELHEFDEAVKHLDNVISNKNNAYYENAIWYSGLCYLKKNKKQQSIQQFKKLLNKDSSFHKRASEILDKMK